MLAYYGHCSFLWTSQQGVRVLIDPYGNEQGRHWFDRRFPPIEAEIVAITHNHFDHNAVEDLPGTPTVLRGPGQLRLDDITVQAVRDLHSGEWGPRGMVNMLFVVESQGVRYCHIGDNRHELHDGVLAQLGTVDVLMVTVDDSRHLLSFDQVDRLVGQVAPRVVVPMHYYIDGLTAETSTLKPPEGWLATQRDVVRLGIGPQEITSKDLPDHRQVWVFSAVLP